MGRKVGRYMAPGGTAIKKERESGKHEEERAAAAEALAAEKAAAQAEAEKKEKERLAALEAEEAKKRKGARYGKRGMPVEEYLGETSPGYRRTLLGS
jgi:membrane protein involved in colicin uptake